MVAGQQWPWSLSVTGDRTRQCGALWVLTARVSWPGSKGSPTQPFTLTGLCTCWPLPAGGPAPEHRESLPACGLPNAAPDGKAAPCPSPQVPRRLGRRLGRRPPEGAPHGEPTAGPGSCPQPAPGLGRRASGPNLELPRPCLRAGTWRPPRPRPLRPGAPGAPGWASGAAASAPAEPWPLCRCAGGRCGPPNPLWAPDPPCPPPQAFPGHRARRPSSKTFRLMALLLHQCSLPGQPGLSLRPLWLKKGPVRCQNTSGPSLLLGSPGHSLGVLLRRTKEPREATRAGRASGGSSPHVSAWASQGPAAGDLVISAHLRRGPLGGLLGPPPCSRGGLGTLIRSLRYPPGGIRPCPLLLASWPPFGPPGGPPTRAQGSGAGSTGRRPMCWLGELRGAAVL